MADAYILSNLHCIQHIQDIHQFMHSLEIKPMTLALLAPYFIVWKNDFKITDNNTCNLYCKTNATAALPFWIIFHAYDKI